VRETATPSSEHRAEREPTEAGNRLGPLATASRCVRREASNAQQTLLASARFFNFSRAVESAMKESHDAIVTRARHASRFERFAGGYAHRAVGLYAHRAEPIRRETERGTGVDRLDDADPVTQVK
jgi:hypothetical protein